MSGYDVNVLPITIPFNEISKFTETYGFVGSQGMVVLEGMHFVPQGYPSDTVVLMMHPSSTLQQLPIPKALAAAGAALGAAFGRGSSVHLPFRYALTAASETSFENLGSGGGSGGAFGALCLSHAESVDPP